MSMGLCCRCVKPPGTSMSEWRKKFWRVVQRRCNHSKFHGSRRTESRYSEVKCRVCGLRWRTKAAYVDLLLDVKVTP